MDEEEKPILVGYLTIKSQNGFSIRIFKKPKYCQLFKASRNGIERLEISDSDNDKNTRIVTLENCVKIVLEQPPTNIINIVTKTGQIQLHSTNEATVKQWKIALQSVAFKENQSSSCVLSQNAVIEEDNDLYCSSYSEGIFTVKLIPTDASVKCGLESRMYTLMLSGTEIQLKCYEDENNIIAMWPYRFIRKYGYRDGKFTFEAGRKCDTGEGTFKLDNANPQEIFRCMSTKMKSMKKNINNDSFNISTNSMSNTFSSVFSALEPGSRSPLPPTPQGSFIDGNSQNPFRSVLTSPEVGNSQGVNKNCIPNKPPRKVVPPSISHQISNITTSHSTNSNVSSVFIKSHHDSHGTPEVVNCKHPVPLPYNRDYECVEDITEAWKKLGIDDVSHTENVPTEVDELSGSVRERSKSSRELKSKYRHESSTVGEGKIVTNPIDGSYDTLEYFRTNHKVSLGYTTIVPITNNNKQSATLMHQSSSCLDDYEIIGDPNATSRNYGSTLHESFDNNVNKITLAPPDTSACRKADDSYLGYGMIRKPSLQSQNSSSGVCNTSNHLFKHDEPDEIHRLDYATIDSDFDHLFGKSLKLFNDWELFSENFLNYVRSNEIKDDRSKKLLLLLEESNFNQDTRDLIICFIFQALIKPTRRSSGKLPTIVQAQQEVCTPCDTEDEYIDNLESLRQECETAKTQLTPRIYAVGSFDNIEAFYVVTGKFEYRLPSFLRCLDVIIKLKHVLNYSFPDSCEVFWCFLTRYFYGIDYKRKSKNSQLLQLIAYLEAHKEEGN